MPAKIKFGTDGWRAIIANDYTVEGVMRTSEGAALWMKERQLDKVVIGYDCRFGGLMFATAAASVFCHYGIKVVMDKNFVSTPMVSLGAVKYQAGLGVVITASHNPPTYNGFKLKAKYGGPSIPKEVSEVEDLIPDSTRLQMKTLVELEETGLISFVDMEDMYIKHVESSFDLPLIAPLQGQMAYDAMYGAGQNVMRRLFPQSHLLHAEYNPGFGGTAPEPIDRNLKQLSEAIRTDDNLTFGLANDGDADRIGMYDEDGVFVDSHRILLLLLKYLVEYKGLKSGKVVCSFSVTDKLKKLANIYGLEYVTTPIGFKYIAEYMSTDDVLLAGEESGGIAVKGHIPERDGVWTGLLLMEYMAKTGKSLKELTEDVFSQVGKFDYYRDDLHLTEEQKQTAVAKCKAGITSFGDIKVEKAEDLDGYKYFLDNGGWLLIRASGTEPVLRIYAQAEDMSEVRKVLDVAKETLLGA
ncbi:MAG: phosphoglucomutase/phosphomannomutase family protein [Saprospiraceae bacterium]|nr:phosphoglucomutase/phosphomannomutase family protein [Saprospiraceae bacterium]